MRKSFPEMIRASLLLVALLALVSPWAQAQDAGNDGGEEPVSEEEAAEKDGIIDTHKAVIDKQIMAVSQWVDSFFSDPNFEAESANTLIRVRPEYYYRKEHGSDFNLKARVKLHLPNFSRRTSLIIGADDEVDTFGDSVDDSASDAIVGLQFFGRQTNKWNTSLSLGVKFNEFAAYIGPRVRWMTLWGDRRSISFTQAIRYQSNSYWNTISRLDFNFLVGEKYFFRQTFDGRWRGERSEDEGFRTRVSSILTRRLPRGGGLQYDFTTLFHTRPETHVDSYTLALRYRKRTARDWLYYEIIPQVSWDDEFDYKFNPGIRLRLEIFYGADSAARFWKREHEDTDDFRW